MTDDSPKPRCAKTMGTLPPNQPDCPLQTLNRRGFLSVTGTSAGLLMVAAALPACGNATGSAPTGPVAAGNVSALSVGMLLVMSNVVVARDAAGVYAMSAVCTHQGCLVDAANDTIAGGLTCPCHRSAFDGSGTVTHGPAGKALQHYAVTILADGSMTVEGGQPVSPATRTTVP
jgi:nitrite reductase/ring-hydroxylating ferredoxin subunit